MKGQSMLLAVLVLGGSIIGATTVAGLLLAYQIRGTTDIRSSAQAIAAADTGVEWALYNFFKSPLPNPTFSDGASVVVTCYDGTGNPTTCNAAGNPATAISKGTSQSAARAFSLNLQVSTQIYP